MKYECPFCDSDQVIVLPDDKTGKCDKCKEYFLLSMAEQKEEHGNQDREV